MLRPTTKPSARIAGRAQQAASRDPGTARLRLRFAVRDDFSEAARIVAVANKRIDELLSYLDMLQGTKVVELVMDLRGERDMLVQLVRDLHLELVSGDEKSTSQDNDSDSDPRWDSQRRERLLYAAKQVQQRHLFRSEKRIRGEEVTAL
ncbi:MAG: hypothetical protein LCH79_16530 [Proteobacteria bacterium]|nr:hypothetical protein [Pseudomonadota bacterium]